MAHIKTVNNQWVVKTIKHDTNDTDTFLMINTTTLCDVAKTFSAGAFKLWIYFMKNKNDYTFALSPTDVRDTFNMGKTQYDNARRELIDKGFLVQMKGNYYTIHDKPYFFQNKKETK